MKKKNILFIMCDQLRADYTGYSGGPVATPNIDRVAEGTSWTNCLSGNPICVPARTSLLTGRYSHQVGMLGNSGDLSHCFTTYPGALREAGYYTAAAGKLHYHHGWRAERLSRQRGHDLVAMRDETMGFGFDRIWEVSGKDLVLHNYCEYAAHLEGKGLLDRYLDDLFARGVYSGYDREDGRASILDEADYIDRVIGDRSLEILRERPADRPFFLLASFCGPHPPYDPPAAWLERVPGGGPEFFNLREGQSIPPADREGFHLKRRAYRAMIEFLDAQVGRLFSFLSENGLLEETVIVFAADHGEMLGDFALSGKSRPWRPSLVVPAAVRHPDFPGRARNDTPVELTDLAATILDVAGLDPAAALGRDWPLFHDRVPALSLMPVVRGEAARTREFAFSESTGWQLVQCDRWKYIRYHGGRRLEEPVEELYDLENDPREHFDRAGDPGLAKVLDLCRLRRDRVLDLTPSCPTFYAPVMKEGRREKPGA